MVLDLQSRHDLFGFKYFNAEPAAGEIVVDGFRI